jgi:hypothetical protein
MLAKRRDPARGLSVSSPSTHEPQLNRVLERWEHQLHADEAAQCVREAAAQQALPSRPWLSPVHSRKRRQSRGSLAPPPPAILSGQPDRIAGGDFVRLAGQDCRRLLRPAGRTGLPAATSSGWPDKIAGGYFVRVRRTPVLQSPPRSAEGASRPSPRSQSRRAPAHSVAR